jgi:GNAT superfamily N-acetyltransferase
MSPPLTRASIGAGGATEWSLVPRIRRVVWIRDAVPDEVGALEDLQRRASLVWEDYRDQLLAHPDAIVLDPAAVTDGLVRVAVDDSGRRLGFSAALDVRGGVCELDGLFVEPDAWRRGIGRALVEDVVDRAGRAGARRLEVIANPRAHGFYERTGFLVVDLATTRFGPASRMRRELQRAAVPPSDG